MWSVAADKKNPEAMYYLAICYQTGRGVPKDLPRALKLYEDSLAGGYEKSKQPAEDLRMRLAMERNMKNKKE